MGLTVYITDNYNAMSRQARDILVPKIAAKTVQDANFFNLGLATGDSPLGLYNHMVRKQKRFNAALMRGFNLDEYVGLPGKNASERVGHPQSYRYQMIQNLYGRLDPTFEERHVPFGTEIDQGRLETSLASAHGIELVGSGEGKAVVIHPGCNDAYLISIKNNFLDAYIRTIENRGGIDWWVVGSGSKGHIAFHESGIPLDLDIMLVKLDPNTITDAVSTGKFTSPTQAPHYAISMGAGGVARLARNVLLVANGDSKTEPLARSLLGPISADVPISILQNYIEAPGEAIYVIDEIAAADIIGNEPKLADKGIIIVDKRR